MTPPARPPAALSHIIRARIIDTALWLAPVCFMLWLYRDGLHCWFIADDFAWLGLLRQLNSPSDLLPLLFAPAAQGTIRPLSERGFFLLFESIFGLDNLPFRIAAFTVMAANLLLLAGLVRRITRSPLAACIAAIVWTANTALVIPMTWSSSFNEILCACFLLSALTLFSKFADSGRPLFWFLQLAVFLLGFGALEINVIYPALAAAWVLFTVPPPHRRKLLLTLAPLFALSVIYFALHRAVATLPTSGPYVLHFDWHILKTLAVYARWTLLPVDWLRFGHSLLLGNAILATEIAALLILLIWALRQRRTIVLFFLFWYLAALAPVLPLSEHHTEYYLLIPLIGFAMLAAWGCCAAWQNSRNPLWRIVSTLAILAYLTGLIPLSRAATHWWREHTTPVRGLVLGLEAAHHTHPNKIILLEGVTPDLYTGAINQGALYAAGTDYVYLTPNSASVLQHESDPATLDKIVIDPAATLHAIQKEQVVVYSVAGDHLRNITGAYERLALKQSLNAQAGSEMLPTRIDVGNPLYSWLLGPSWNSSESGVRWMPGKATVKLAGPKAGNKLLLEGFLPADQLRQAPRHLTVSVDGFNLGTTQISDPESTFRRLFDMPESLLGRNAVELEVRVDPVTRKDGLEYGLVFGRIAFLP